MAAYSLLIFIQSFVKFQILDPKIEMKKAKRPFILTNRLTILVIEPAMSWLQTIQGSAEEDQLPPHGHPQAMQEQQPYSY